VSSPVPHAPQCHACGAYLEPPGHYCPACRAPQPQFLPPSTHPVAYGAPMVPMVTAKSAGIAVLLSFLWLGAGHLYANRTTAGILLIVYDTFLVLLSITLVGAIVAVPLWLISAPIVMVLAANAANDFNRRNGIVVR
jgi:TM2 domain-containing membrane protein YozV